MATLNITLPDEMKSFVESKIGPGKFQDANAYAQWLIAEDMERQPVDFSPEERKKIDQMLLDAMDSLERGEAVPVRPGEFDALAQHLVEKHQGKQAS